MKITEVSRDHAYARRRGWLDSNGANSGAIGDVQEDGSSVVSPVIALDAGHGLDITDEGSGVAGIAVDETELDGSLIPGIPSSLTVEDEGTPLATAADTLNFVGAGVTATGSGATKTITIPGTTTSTFELNIEGGQDVIKAHGSMGSTETFDPTDGNVHTGTLDANCTFTLNAPSGSGAASLEFWLTQDGTGGRTVTWPGSVTEQGTHDTTASTTQRVVVETVDGGTTWIATWIGGGISSSSFATPAIVLGTAAAAGTGSSVIRHNSTIVAFDATTPANIGTAATGSAAVAARRDHVHGTGAGTPTTSAIGDAAATGTGPAAAMTDHVHGREALSTAIPLVESGTGDVGTGVKSSREDHVHPATSGGGLAFIIIGQEERISDGSTTAWTLDNDFEDWSVSARNLTTGHNLSVVETLPNIATISAAGTAGDVIAFAYAATAI